MKTIDDYELSAANAMFTAKANNSKKRLKLKDLYDADKIRKSIDNPKTEKRTELSLERYKKAKEAMKGYSPSMK
ncbi:hypothetical protein JNUCC23_01990 [Peribacillus sp. JNUCC 23]